MNRFDTLLEASKFATKLSARWNFANSDEKYERNSLLGIAEIHDGENPADEDSFYVVSPGGDIGYCEDGEDIDWLFLVSSDKRDVLPSTFTASPQINFCSKCGNRTASGHRFCEECGARLS